MEESSTIRAFIEEGRRKGREEGRAREARKIILRWVGSVLASRRRSRVQAGRNLGPGKARTARGTTLHRLELGRTAQRGVIQRGPAWSTKPITGHPRACATWVYHPHYYCLIQVDDGTTQTGTDPAVDRGMAADRGDRGRECPGADVDDGSAPDRTTFMSGGRDAPSWPAGRRSWQACCRPMRTGRSSCTCWGFMGTRWRPRSDRRGGETTSIRSRVKRENLGLHLRL